MTANLLGCLVSSQVLQTELMRKRLQSGRGTFIRARKDGGVHSNRMLELVLLIIIIAVMPFILSHSRKVTRITKQRDLGTKALNLTGAECMFSLFLNGHSLVGREPSKC